MAQSRIVACSRCCSGRVIVAALLVSLITLGALAALAEAAFLSAEKTLAEQRTLRAVLSSDTVLVDRLRELAPDIGAIFAEPQVELITINPAPIFLLTAGKETYLINARGAVDPPLPDWRALADISTEMPCVDNGAADWELSRAASQVTCRASTLIVRENTLVRGNLVVSRLELRGGSSSQRVSVAVAGDLRAVEALVISGPLQAEIIVAGNIELGALQSTGASGTQLLLVSTTDRVAIRSPLQNQDLNCAPAQARLRIEARQGIKIAGSESAVGALGCEIARSPALWPSFLVAGRTTN